MRHRSSEINHQIGQLYLLHHNLVKLHVSLKVAVAHIALRVVVGCEDKDALMKGTVLDNNILRIVELENILEAFLKEKYLHRKRPTL